MNFRETRGTKTQISNYIRNYNKVKEEFEKFILDFNAYLSTQIDFPLKVSEKLDQGIRIELFLEKVDITMGFVEYKMYIWGKLFVSVFTDPDKNDVLFVMYFDDDGNIYLSLEDEQPASSFTNRYFSETIILMAYNAILSKHSYLKEKK